MMIVLATKWFYIDTKSDGQSFFLSLEMHAVKRTTSNLLSNSSSLKQKELVIPRVA